MQGISVHAYDFATTWRQLLLELVLHGDTHHPRGMETREILGVQLTVHDSYSNILYSPIRNLSYKFMVAEWLWISAGCNDVASIAKYNKNISKFSDNGETFWGAYGPRLTKQHDYMVSTLIKDPDSRQAVSTIYEPTPPATKDVPCTVSFQVFIRGGKMHAVVNMRSSDIWLGLPYDFFNFTRMQERFAAIFGLESGPITFNLGSSHLYSHNYEQASSVLDSAQVPESIKSPRLTGLFIEADFSESYRTRDSIMTCELIRIFKDDFSGAEQTQLSKDYRQVLDSATNQEALDVLTSIAR
jgi:thymidylate synthase